MKRSDKYVAPSNLSMYYTWKYEKLRSENFELPDVSYSVIDIQDYFEYIIKEHEKLTNNPPIRIYVNKLQNKITFTYYLYYLYILAFNA